MQELFSSLRQNLSLKGPNSDDVKAVLAEIEKRFPDQLQRARSMRDGWLLSQGKPLDDNAATLRKSGVNFLSWKFIVPVLGALGIGARRRQIRQLVA